MANEDLIGQDPFELGHLRRLTLESSGMPEREARLVAIYEQMASLGFWRCDHCDETVELPLCRVCGRLAEDQPPYYSEYGTA